NFSSNAVVECRYAPADNTGNIAATGTTPHTATPLCQEIPQALLRETGTIRPALLDRNRRCINSKRRTVLSMPSVRSFHRAPCSITYEHLPPYEGVHHCTRMYRKC
ncbi:unnamed protein product, partial [Laminaria digitata]